MIYEHERVVKGIKMISTYIFFKCVQDESLELTKAFVYSCSPAFLHDRFG